MSLRKASHNEAQVVQCGQTTEQTPLQFLSSKDSVTILYTHSFPDHVSNIAYVFLWLYILQVPNIFSHFFEYTSDFSALQYKN